MGNEEFNTTVVKKTIAVGLKTAEAQIAMCEINVLAGELKNLTGHELATFKSTTKEEVHNLLDDVDHMIDQFDNALDFDTRLMYRQAIGGLRIRLMALKM